MYLPLIPCMPSYFHLLSGNTVKEKHYEFFMHGHKYTCISVSVQRATPETWGEAFQPSHPAAQALCG